MRHMRTHGPPDIGDTARSLMYCVTKKKERWSVLAVGLSVTLSASCGPVEPGPADRIANTGGIGGDNDGSGGDAAVECPLVADECPAECEVKVRGYAVDEERMCVHQNDDDWKVVGCFGPGLGACKSAAFCFERISDGALFIADGCLDEPAFSSEWRPCSSDIDPEIEAGSRSCDNLGGSGPE